MKKKKITKSFSNLAEYRDRFTTFGDVKPNNDTDTVKPIMSDISSEDLLINAEKFIKEYVLPTKALCDMDGFKLNVKSYCENILAKYGMNNTKMRNEVLKLCKKYGLF